MPRLLLVVAASLLLVQTPVQAKLPPQPPRTELAASARWLLCAASWGTLATDGSDANNDLGAAAAVPFANVAAFADGLVTDGMPQNCSGEPVFYMTKLDASARDLAKNDWAALAVSMAGLEPGNFCTSVSAADPTCWRLTLTGHVRPIAKGPERDAALASLYSRHPDMRGWGNAHHFKPMKLHVEKVFFLNFYGGAHPISVKEYLSAVTGKPVAGHLRHAQALE